jgi:hypothetical protein
VAGTSEANSQMIVVEEWIKDSVERSKGQAKLWVAVEMFDTDRHIGRRIVYDVELYNSDQQHTSVHHFEFDPLSRRRPLTMKNRSDRYGARELHGTGGTPPAKPHDPRTQPTAHGPLHAPGRDPETARVDAAVDNLFSGTIDAFHLHVEQMRSNGEEVPVAIFQEVGERLTPDRLHAYLVELRKTSFNDERTIGWVVYGCVADKTDPVKASVLSDVLEPLYAPAPVPERLRKICRPKPVAPVAMDV